MFDMMYTKRKKHMAGYGSQRVIFTNFVCFQDSCILCCAAIANALLSKKNSHSHNIFDCTTLVCPDTAASAFC